MKQILLVLLSIGFSLSLSAQKIHFMDTSNVWKELQPEYNAPLPWLFRYYTYSFIGDSTVDSVEYRHFGFGFVREDTILNKVYVRDLTGDSDILLMDYNLTLGDTFTTAYYQFAVIRIDSTLINAVWHKVWYFPPIPAGIYGGDPICVIEGIGCIQSPVYLIGNYNRCVECSAPLMYCFSSNGITPPLSPPVSFLDNDTSCSKFANLDINQLQSPHGKINIYPNPATTSFTIQLNTLSQGGAEGQITITNLLGQTVYTQSYNSPQVNVDVSTLPQGMYLVKINGTEVRKFVKQ